MTFEEPTLRTKVDECKKRGNAFTLPEALALVVPFIVELAEVHKQGGLFYVYPGAISAGSDGSLKLNRLANSFPTSGKDQAAMPSELSADQPGDARASVYSIAAILYELITLELVSPSMRRPSEIAVGIGQDFELILSKALVAEPGSRPDDLNALAQAFHLVNPSASIAPPAAVISNLDHDDGFDVDVSLSMLPPPVAGRVEPSYGEAPLPPGIADLAAASTEKELRMSRLSDTEMLVLLKERLQKDPSPRYVVVSSGMDHGPFSAFELVQQISALSFLEHDVIKDSVTGSSASIANSPQFAPFARHAHLRQEESREKVAIEQAVEVESRKTKGKSIFGVAFVVLLVAAVGGFVFSSRGKRRDVIKIQHEVAANIDSEKSLITRKSTKRPRNSSAASARSVPQIRGGLSCAAAQSTYIQEIKMNGPKGKADLTAGAFGAQLNSGSYLNGCGINDSTSVSICAAIQNGKAVGVTVTTSPKKPSANSCVASKVRAMRFPSHPKLDITTTTFAAQ